MKSEAELEADANIKEPPIVRNGCVYNRNKKTKREELLKDLLVVEIPCILSDDEIICKQCDGDMKQIAFNKIRDELEYVPAKVRIIRYM